MPTALKNFLYFPQDRRRQGPALLGMALTLLLLHALRLVFALDGQLHPDEAYYWAWSQKPALSYYDQGPGIAYYIWLWTLVLGNNYVALKLAALAASFLTIYMFCLAGRDLGMYGWQPLVSGLILFFIPGILGGNALIMHDSMMILAWSGALWMSVRAIRWRRALDLLGLFFFLGLGGLSKYTMFLFAIALVVWLILHPSYREFWVRPASWAGLAMAVLIITPIILWNMQNHWDGVGAIIHLRSSGGTQGGGSTGAYLAGQFIMFSPLWMAALLALAASETINWLRKQRNRFFSGMDSTKGNPAPPLVATEPGAKAGESREHWEEKQDREARKAGVHLLWILTAVPFLFFAFLSASREIQANWVFPAYGSAVLLLALFLLSPSKARTDSKSADGREAGRTEDSDRTSGGSTVATTTVRQDSESSYAVLPGPGWIRVLFLGGWIPVALLDIFFLFSIPISVYLPLETYWVPGYRTMGFHEVIMGVERVQKEHPDAALVANRYQDASIGWFYNSGQNYVASINIMQRNQFSYWPGLEKGKDYIFYHIQENTCEKSVSFLGLILPTFFEDVVEYPEQDIVRNRRVVKRYQVWYARGYKHPWDQKMFEYLQKDAIFQNMVGLRVPPPGKVIQVNKAFEQFMELWTREYMSRKGKQDCSIF